MGVIRVINLLHCLSWGMSSDELFGRIGKFLSACEVLEPMSYRNLRLFPIISPDGQDLPTIISLDEAIIRRELLISEVGEGVVNKVQMKNTSEHYVFVMAGEILIGCKQNRILEEDILLAPKSEEVTASVFCVEAQRWFRTSDTFTSVPIAASPGVRKVARVSKSQTRVWDEVSCLLYALQVEDPSQDLKSAYEAPKVRGSIEEYVDALGKLPDKFPEANGVVVGIGEETLCADLFSLRKLFENLYPKLLRSFAGEALAKSEAKGELTCESAEAFLKKSFQVSKKMLQGAADLLEIESSDSKGSALIFKGSIIHTAIFSGKEEKKVRPRYIEYRF